MHFICFTASVPLVPPPSHLLSLLCVLKCFAIILAYFLIMPALSASSLFTHFVYCIHCPLELLPVFIFSFCFFFLYTPSCIFFVGVLFVCMCARVCLVLFFSRGNKACRNMQTMYWATTLNKESFFFLLLLLHRLAICLYLHAVHLRGN